MNLERLLTEVKYQRDLWKDRFSFNAISLAHRFLRAHCKGEMREAQFNRSSGKSTQVNCFYCLD